MYRIEFASSAARQFRQLPSDVQRRLAPDIDALSLEPRPAGSRKLVTDEELWRVRVGPYRIVYAVEDGLLLVLVVKLGHRRDVYRGI
jgi:mRNA interferase RelE/StbE